TDSLEAASSLYVAPNFETRSEKYRVPKRMLISGLVNDAVVNPRRPTARASLRPVEGTSVINPQAFADDLTPASKVDSWAISAAIRYGSRSCAADCFRIESQYTSGKIT